MFYLDTVILFYISQNPLEYVCRSYYKWLLLSKRKKRRKKITGLFWKGNNKTFKWIPLFTIQTRMNLALNLFLIQSICSVPTALFLVPPFKIAWSISQWKLSKITNSQCNRHVYVHQRTILSDVIIFLMSL